LLLSKEARNLFSKIINLPFWESLDSKGDFIRNKMDNNFTFFINVLVIYLK